MRPTPLERAGPPGGEREVQRRPFGARRAEQHAGRLAADPHDVALDGLEQHAQVRDLLGREVGERGGVEHAHERARRRALDQRGEERERVAAADLHRAVLARDRQRRLQPRVARGLVGPQAGVQPAHVARVGHVDGREVDAAPPRHRRRLERRHGVAAQLAGDPQRRGGIPRGPARVVVGVVVPQPVQPRARADLDLRERPPARHGRERGQQAGAARGLVRLRAAGGERRRELGLARGAERLQRAAQRRVRRAVAAGGRVVRRQRVIGIAQELVVDRGEEHHRRRLGGARREREQRRRVGRELAHPGVQRRVGADRLAAEASHQPCQPGRIHDLAR